MIRGPLEVNVYAPERTQYVTKHVDVHEHRAPTDQSVALLKEMEQAARDKVEQSIKVSDNGFECSVQTYWDALSNDQVAVAVFSLNGKRLRAQATADKRLGGDPQAALVEALLDEIAEVVAKEVLRPALTKAFFGP